MKASLTTRIFLRIQNKLQIDTHDATKTILSALVFFFIIGAYSILRSLKTSIFLGFVGREYEPIVKIAGILITIPAMIVHSKIIDAFRRHQVVYVFIGFYAFIAFFFACLFAHPVYGVANTLTSPYRLTGWAFEIFMDLFQALIVGTFWSFINSINTPTLAEKGYGFVVAGSRVGGILTPLISWLVLEKSSLPGSAAIPLLTILAGFLLFFALYSTYLMNKLVPASHMQGYEEQPTDKQPIRKKTNVLEGLKLMLTEPYVLGIFCLVFSYEVINIIFDYQMHVLMSIETNNEISAMSSFMFLYTGTFQLLSLLFALFGTSALLKRFGVAHSLLIMPIITMGLALVPIFYPKLFAIFSVMVLLRAFNYGFNHPLREMLFIPTTKDIKFKSKAWIESFGRTFSKTTGSSINMIAISGAPELCIILESCFSFGLAFVWAIIALAVGKKYAKSIYNKIVIGKKG